MSRPKVYTFAAVAYCLMQRRLYTKLSLIASHWSKLMGPTCDLQTRQKEMRSGTAHIRNLTT